jgi:chromosome partitioning protein
MFPVVCTAPVERFSETLERLRKYGCELVFVDLPGRSAAHHAEAFARADLVLVPCRPSGLDVQASIPTVRMLRKAKAAYAYVISIAPPQRNCRRSRDTRQTLERTGRAVSPVRITQRMEVQDAAVQGKGVNEFAPGGAANQEFQQLYMWVISRLAGITLP